MAMATVTLAKALKLKNRRAQKISSLSTRIQTYNSYVAGSEPEFDVVSLLSELRDEKSRLWHLKAAINAANAPVYGTIYELAEIKGMIAFLRGLNTQRGRAAGHFMMPSEPVEFVAQITAAEVSEEVERLEATIDDLQDRLDTFNASTLIEIEE